jgi:hypothetical protein
MDTPLNFPFIQISPESAGGYCPSVFASALDLIPLFQFRIKALSSLALLRHLNVLISTPRRLNPRRLDFIFDLKLVLAAFYAYF